MSEVILSGKHDDADFICFVSLLHYLHYFIITLFSMQLIGFYNKISLVS